MNYCLFIFSLLFYYVCSSLTSLKDTALSEKKRIHEEFVEYGTKNGIKINKIKYNVETNSYISQEHINKDEILLTIPKNISITVSNILKNAPKKYKKLWNKYYKNVIKEDIKNLSNEEKQISFITLLDQYLYISKKGKIYNNLKYILEDRDLGDREMESFPTLIDDGNMDLNTFTYCSRMIFNIRQKYIDECENFKNNYNINCNEDIYLLLRANQKAFRYYNNTVIIFPIINRIKIHPWNYNVYEVYDNKKEVYILKALKNINKNEDIIIKSKYTTNLENFIYYGTTFDNLNETLVKIQIMSYSFADQMKLDDNITDLTDYSLKDGNCFDIMFQYYYHNVSKIITGKESKLEAYKLLYYNIKRSLDDLNNVDDNSYKLIYNKEVGLHIKRVVSDEKILIKKRFKQAEDLYNNAKNEKKEDL